MKELLPCGDTYIKFDEKGNPEYGFLVDEQNIVKFMSLSNKEHKQIVLPDVFKDGYFCSKEIDDKYIILMSPREKKKYVMGDIKILDGCFENLNDTEIIVPFETSLLIEPNAFNQNSNITLKLKEKIGRKIKLYY